MLTPEPTTPGTTGPKPATAAWTPGTPVPSPGTPPLPPGTTVSSPGAPPLPPGIAVPRTGAAAVAASSARSESKDGRFHARTTRSEPRDGRFAASSARCEASDAGNTHSVAGDGPLDAGNNGPQAGSDCSHAAAARSHVGNKSFGVTGRRSAGEMGIHGSHAKDRGLSCGRDESTRSGGLGTGSVIKHRDDKGMIESWSWTAFLKRPSTGLQVPKALETLAARKELPLTSSGETEIFDVQH